MSEISTGPHHSPGRYEIRLKGHLDSRWAAWFDGLSLTNVNDGTTIICGPGHIAQAHQPNEWVALEQLRECEAFMRRLASEVCVA